MDGNGGPLSGIRVVEFAGLGPAPFCGMLLADLGAQVLRIDRPGSAIATTVTSRGRHTLELDLKRADAIQACLELFASTDIVIEGFRPGVMERLGLGPQEALGRNPALVYGRMTGWGQAGPYASSAGHDINYLAISGALHAIGPAERPTPPLNIVGDFGGGALYLAFGLVSALLHQRSTGVGQVVDAAITDGAASLLAMQYGYLASGRWVDARESNRLDGGRPYYSCYRCLDGEWLAVGALEPKFYAIFEEKLGLADPLPDRDDPEVWPVLRARIAARIAERTRDDWAKTFEGVDACVTAVMSLSEAPRHPHNVARRAFVECDDVVQPAPAPRFSATPGSIQPTIREAGAIGRLLAGWGVSEPTRAALTTP